jgi:atypical dual specificity phosphatase
MINIKKKFAFKVQIPKEKQQENKFLITKTNSSKECTFIIDNIYISDYRKSLDYQFLIQNKFTHIINCAGGSEKFNPIFFKEFQYFNIKLRDDGNLNLIRPIFEFISIIKKITNEKSNKILIHCYEGISRAPALVCAYLIWKLNFNLENAIKFIKEKRKCIDINLGFLTQLNDFQMNKDFFDEINEI